MKEDTYQIIDGKACAKDLLESVQSELDDLKKRMGKNVGLAVVLVGNDPASSIYVNNKAKKAKELGINSSIHRFDFNVNEKELITHIAKLNSDQDVNGILVQLPLPNHINTQKIIDAVAYEKDVDGFGTYNVGLLNSWQESLEPCTPQGIMLLLKKYIGRNIAGKRVAVLGRSRIVGRPIVTMLIKEGCSVMSLNSHSSDIPNICRDSDIVISAVGLPLMIKKDWIMPGACVIDVGIIKVGDKLFGDVDFDEVKKVAGIITPVPGGVGPMTVACLMRNTLRAAYMQRGIQWQGA